MDGGNPYVTCVSVCPVEPVSHHSRSACSNNDVVAALPSKWRPKPEITGLLVVGYYRQQLVGGLACSRVPKYCYTSLSKTGGH